MQMTLIQQTLKKQRFRRGQAKKIADFFRKSSFSASPSPINFWYKKKIPTPQPCDQPLVQNPTPRSHGGPVVRKKKKFQLPRLQHALPPALSLEDPPRAGNRRQAVGRPIY